MPEKRIWTLLWDHLGDPGGSFCTAWRVCWWRGNRALHEVRAELLQSGQLHLITGLREILDSRVSRALGQTDHLDSLTPS